MTDTLTDGYHYAIVFDKEKSIEKKKDLPIPYCEGFCCKNYQYLSPVPSYEQWQAKLEENTNLKEQINKCCMDAINRGTANAVKAVKEFGMPERIKELVEQNAQLKELLKECRDEIEYLRKHYKGNIDHHKNNTRLDKEINQVLGEE